MRKQSVCLKRKKNNMEHKNEKNYDIVVIGAGHAGVEAALASARMGHKTLLLTLNLDSVGLMPCNPAIGGTGKGHLVREIDALGGEMGLAADDTLIQMRMLNTGKGPAVHSLRAQMDKHRYHERVKRALEEQPNLTLAQGEASRFLTEGGRISGVETAEGFVYPCRAAVVCAGVYMKSRILIGELARNSGPAGLLRSETLSDALKELGIPIQRFKTGTPARVNGLSLDYHEMERQDGDVPTPAFSFLNGRLTREQTPCYLTYTNDETHRVILDNLQRSAMYSGQINATGTRYCPSIEDKLVRFADKERHQIFIEPEGRTTNEMYVQGMSTSLPGDVQIAMLRTMPGMHRCEVMRLGYAIEYDCVDPTVLDASLAVHTVPGLYLAGQVNGTSGYEEAAAQGLLAGINAAFYCRGEEPLTLGRDEAYLGVLVDDLSVKGTPEPYRMMTSRCEYRLLLRQDNADDRLTHKALRTGLISGERYERLMQKRERIETALAKLDRTVPPSEALRQLLTERGESVPQSGVKLFDLLKRTNICYTDLLSIFDSLSPLDWETEERVETLARYDGYIQKQQEQVNRSRALENTPLPQDVDYLTLDGLRLEARQKLNKHKPANIGMAGRISGVTPADVNVLLIYTKRGFQPANGKTEVHA